MLRSGKGRVVGGSPGKRTGLSCPFLGERRPHRAHRVVHRARTAQAFLATLFGIFQVFFRVARARWPKQYAYNNGGLHSSLLTKGGCSCPHPLPGEGCRKRKKKM